MHNPKYVNTVLNDNRNHKAYQGCGEGVWRWEEEGDFIPVAKLSPLE